MRWGWLLVVSLVIGSLNAAEGQNPPDREFSLEHVTTVVTSSGSILAPKWSRDAMKVAYIEDLGAEQRLMLLDLLTLQPAELVGAESGAALDISATIAWSPSGTQLLFCSDKFAGTGYATTISRVSVAGGVITDLVVTPADFALDNESTSLVDPFISRHQGKYYLFVSAISGEPAASDIWVIEVDMDGNPVEGTAQLLIDGGNLLLRKPAVLSYVGYDVIDSILFEEVVSSVSNRAWCHRGYLQPFFNGSYTAFNGTTGAHPAASSGATFVADPQFSQDGIYVFWTEDFNHIYDASNPSTLATADFDLVVQGLSYLNTNDPDRQPFRIPLPGNQRSFSASPGGTRIAAVTHDATTGSDVVTLASLAVTQNNFPIDPETNLALGSLNLEDGSGTVVNCPPGTLVLPGEKQDFFRQPVTVSTPITPLQELTVTGQGIPVFREFSPSLTFDPPAMLIITYTDEEIVGDENELQLYNLDGDVIEAAEIVERTPEYNRIIAAVPHFSTWVLALPSQLDPNDLDGDGLTNTEEQLLGTDPESWDTDGDGLSDYAEVWWDGEGSLNPYHAVDNPGGTDTDPLNPDTDGDGVRDGEEATFGSDPLDETSTVSLPVSMRAVLALLVALMLLGICAIRVLRPALR